MRRSKQAESRVGRRLIVAYKLSKALAETLVGVLLLSASGHVAGGLRHFAELIELHATAAWSHALARWVFHEATPHRLHLVALAALFDGALSSLEGWSVHRRVGWGDWLVVAATACALPFEIAALLQHPSPVRFTVLGLNAAIVWYLVTSRVRH